MGQIMISGLQKKAESRLQQNSNEICMLQMKVQESLDTLAAVEKTVDSTAAYELITSHNYLAQTAYFVSIVVKFKPRIRFRNPVAGTTICNMYKKPITGNVMAGILRTVFSNEQMKCKLLREFGNFKLAGNTVAKSQQVLVYDIKKQKIHIFDRNFDFCDKRLVLRSSPHPARGFALSLDGNLLVARVSMIEVYSLTIFEYVCEINFTQDHEKIGKNRHACGIAVLADERIAVGDVGNSTIILISKDGVVLRVSKVEIRPIRICAMPNGHIAVSDWRAGKICIIGVETGKEILNLYIPLVFSVFYHTQTDCLLIGRYRYMDEGHPIKGTGAIEQYCATSGKMIGRVVDWLYNPSDLTVMSHTTIVQTHMNPSDFYRQVKIDS